MENKLGIENLKTVLKTACAIGSKLAESLSDGKFSLIDALKMLPEFGNIKQALQAIKQAKAEYLDLTDQERLELHDFVGSHLNLPGNDGRVEKLIEAGFDIVLGASIFISLLGKQEDADAGSAEWTEPTDEDQAPPSAEE